MEAQEYATAEEDPPDEPAPEARPPFVEPERPAAEVVRQDQLAVAVAQQPGLPGQVAPRGASAGEVGAARLSPSVGPGSSSGGLSPGSWLGFTDDEIRARALSDIDLVNETMDGYA